MPNINITDRKVFSQYHNGPNFTLNLTDSLPSLFGCVMDKVKVVHTILVGWQSNATEYNRILFDPTINRITRTTGSFITDGWAIGDTYTADASYTSPPASYAWTGNVTAVSDLEMFVTVATGIPPAYGLYLDFNMYGTTPLTALQLSFGLIENNENVSYNSKFDGTEQVYYASGITGAFTTMTPLGTARSWVTGDARVRSLGALGNYQQFEIENTFVLMPYYLEGELSNLQTLSEPLLYQGTNSLKYVTKYEFRSLLANPNTSKIIEDSQLLGSVGWFNENYNGLNNRFAVSNVTYDSGTSIQPNTAVQINATIDCTDASSPFNTNSIVGVYISYLPPQDEYLSSPTPFKQVWKYDNLFSGGTGTDIIQSVTSTLINANQLEVEAIVNVPGVNLTPDSYFIVAFEIATEGTANGNTDRVMLLGDVRAFDVSNDIPDLFEIKKLEFWGHKDDVSVAGFGDYRGWVEDTFNVKGLFELDLSLGAVLESFKVKLVAYNPTTEDLFELDEYNYNLTPNLIVAGTQVLNLVQPYGYGVNMADQFNVISLKNAGVSGQIRRYEFILSEKIDWQEWISLPNANTIFYNPTENFNGLNQNASNYNLINGYGIRIVVDAVVTGTEYRVISPELEAWNYDTDGNSPAKWTGAIKTFADAGLTLDITPNILQNQPTYVEAEFTKPLPDTCLATDFTGILRIETEGNTSETLLYELSSRYGANPQSPLQSTLGSGLLDIITISPQNVKLRGKIENSLLMNTRHKLSARLFCNCIEVLPPIGRVTNTYTGTTNQGDFTGTFHITEWDNVTPLQLGDEVHLSFFSGTNGYFLGEATFPYGADISSATPIFDNDFVANLRPYFASGSIVTNGGSYVFLKKPFAHNWHNNHGGQLAGINLGEELVIEIRVKDASTGLSSVNVDYTTNLRVLYNIINSSSGGSRGGSPTSAQSFLLGIWDNNAQVETASQLSITTNGVTSILTTSLMFPGNVFQADISGYEDRIFTGSTRTTPFGFTNASCPLPFAPPLTITNRWQKEGSIYITTRNLWQQGVQDETTKTTTFFKNIRAYSYGVGQWGNTITQCWLRIATNPGDDPNVNFTPYNFAEPMNGASNTYTVGTITFPSEGIYDTNAEIHTNSGTQPASFARDQILVYSY